MRKRRRAFPAVLTACAALALTGAGPAPPPAHAQPAAAGPAEAPVPLVRVGGLTDRVGALGDRTPEVRAALIRLDTARGLRLHVVYVSTFSGRSPQDWANATAVENGLGRSDLLLAVATHDRRYAVSADQDAGLTQAQLGRVSEQAIEPALRQNDWAGAAIGAAEGYDAVLAGRPVTPPAITPGAADPGAAASGGAGALWIPAGALAAAAFLGLWAYRRRRAPGGAQAGDRRRPLPVRTARGGSGPPAGARTAKQPTPITPLPELDAQARRMLVATDDAVRTSREDVEFAAAQAGTAAAKPFAEAVDYAEAELAAAFRLRQRLDDVFPEDDETRRLMLDEILSRCTQADRRLDAESEAFDRLRSLRAEAPQVLELAQARLAALPGRVAAAEAALPALAGRFADSALEPVAAAAAEARDRLDFARTSLDHAHTLMDTDRARAAAFVRAAEGALSQATVLADSVTRRERELHAAQSQLHTALAETTADVEEARALLGAAASAARGAGDTDAAPGPAGAPPDGDGASGPGPAAGADGSNGPGDAHGAKAADRAGPAHSTGGSGDAGDAGRAEALAILSGRVGRAEAVVREVRRVVAGGRYDPVAALRRVEEAGAALDAALGEVRGGAPGGRPALLRQALLAAGSEVAAARDLVTTHRGAIGSQARTRLAEAVRRLRLAESAAAVPEGLAHAHAADRLAQEARQFARQDVSGFAEFGGPGPGRRIPEGRDTGGLGGAVLGGILLGGMLGGGYGDAYPDPYGSGRYASGPYDGGGGPGSFGGGRTRGRLGAAFP